MSKDQSRNTGLGPVLVCVTMCGNTAWFNFSNLGLSFIRSGLKKESGQNQHSKGQAPKTVDLILLISLPDII